MNVITVSLNNCTTEMCTTDGVRRKAVVSSRNTQISTQTQSLVYSRKQFDGSYGNFEWFQRFVTDE